MNLAVVALLVLNVGLLVMMFLYPPGGQRLGGPRLGGPSGRPGRPGEQEGPKQIIADKLNFSGDQVARYEELIKAHRVAVKRLNDQIKATKESLYATLATDDSTRKDSLITHLGELQKQVEKVHYTHFEAIRKICTPEQLDNYKELTRELAGYFALGKKPPLRP